MVLRNLRWLAGNLRGRRAWPRQRRRKPGSAAAARRVERCLRRTSLGLAGPLRTKLVGRWKGRRSCLAPSVSNRGIARLIHDGAGRLCWSPRARDWPVRWRTADPRDDGLPSFDKNGQFPFYRSTCATFVCVMAKYIEGRSPQFFEVIPRFFVFE